MTLNGLRCLFSRPERRECYRCGLWKRSVRPGGRYCRNCRLVWATLQGYEEDHR